MTKKQKKKYEDSSALQEILQINLAGKKFKLDCGHHITFGHFLGNDLTIRNGAKHFSLICAQCGY